MRIYAADSVNKKDGYLSGIIALILLMSGIGLFFSAFAGNVFTTVFILLEAVILSTVLAVLENKPTVQHILRAGLIILLALWIMLDFTGIRRAMLNCINSGIDYINEAFTKDFVRLGVQEAQSFDYIALFSILTAVAVMLIQYFTSRKNAAAITVITFIILITALLLRLEGVSVILALTVIGWAGCWSGCTAAGARSVAYISAGLMTVFILGSVVLGIVGFDGFEVLNDLHEDTAQLIYKLRFGEDTLPKGDLFKADTMLEGDENTVKVTFGKPEAMYLKGFTGGSFEENRWIEYKKDAYLDEWSGMLDYFKANDFDTGSIYAQYHRLDEGEEEYNTVTVENIGADRKYAYLPFTAAQVSGGVKHYRDLYDKSVRMFGAKKYSFTNVITDEKPERLSASEWGGGSENAAKAEFLKKENVYRAFVRDTYLDLDDRTRSEIDEVFYKEFDKKADEVGIYTITTRIRSILKLLTSYTEYPTEPQDKDFTGWFLSDYRKGNSVYYATVAAMAYRAAGIPARYAEGYYISDTDVENLLLTKKNSILLSNKNAHAWVEIYRDGMGWVSVEVTPGFYVEDTDEMKVIDISHKLDEQGGVNGNSAEQLRGNLSMYSPEKASRPDERMNSGLRILLILICISTIFMAIMYIRYIILIYLKNERLYGEPNDETANYMMMYLCAALAADKMSANPDNTIAIRRDILAEYDVFRPQEFDRVATLISRSSYGGARLREHELRTIRLFIEKLSSEIYKGKSFLRKIILKYVKIV